MLIESAPISQIMDSVYNAPPPAPAEFILKENPLKANHSGVRPDSVSIEGSILGDEGKGHGTQEVNDQLLKGSSSGEIYSLRYNGGRNAGHEIFINKDPEFIAVALHQLPVAVTQEGATGIMGRGMLVHPDVRTEARYVEKKLGAALPGDLLIDNNAILSTDLHGALETFINNELGIGGSTSSGIAEGYSSGIQKRAVTIRDFGDDKWEEKLAQQYRLYAKLLGGTDVLANSLVYVLTEEGKREKRPVGSLAEFIDRLADVRPFILEHAVDIRPVLEDVWRNRLDIPVTLEGAQGGLLDPQFGVYPDVTASRPIGRIGIPDSTEGVILFDQIALTAATIKEPYMSGVGSRVHPYQMASDMAAKYRQENDETGRSTGRERGVYPIDLEAMRVIQKIAGYRYLIATHLDSNRPDRPIEVITHYVDKQTKQPVPYRPYQWRWDQVEGVVAKLKSWNGADVAKATRVEDFPPECLQFLRFISEAIAPVTMVTNGPQQGKAISFLP